MEIKTTNYGICSVQKVKYPSNGNLALSLIDETGSPVINITTNISPMAENEFCANIHNIGVTLWNDIVASGLLEETGKKVPSGYCFYPVCKLVKELA